MNKCKHITIGGGKRPASSTFSFMSVLRIVRSELHELSTFDDPTLANVCLLCGGGILACVALVCIIAGLYYIRLGDFASSKALAPYFTHSAFFAGLAFRSVRSSKRRGGGQR